VEETKIYFKDLINKQRRGEPKGIYSVCSINKYVLEGTFQHASKHNSFALIESTCNQVNQFGGYTGMTPRDFKNYVFSMARNMKFPREKIILGGDHIGPYPFKKEKYSVAMAKAQAMIKEFVISGYTKIHVDTSMSLADDLKRENKKLDTKIIADRCTELVRTSENSFNELRKENKNAIAPVYVIGADVPSPGGSDDVEKGRRITEVADLRETMAVTKDYFYQKNLHDAWDRVIAVVVQLGVEHGNNIIIDYDRTEAKELTDSMNDFPNIIFEGHSTDYQSSKNLKEMVEDGIAILKLGPSLTNALRETVFMLNYIEEELFMKNHSIKLSKFIKTLDGEMKKNPKFWENYYKGDEREIEFARKYSFFDRSRYYWGNRYVKESLDLLISNLCSTKIPLSLISQFLPKQYNKVKEGLLNIDPIIFVREGIMNILDKYSYAVGIS